MNRYNETPQEVLKLLNAKPEFSEEAKYKVELQVKGVDIIQDLMDTTEWSGNPLTTRINLEYRTVEKDEDGDDSYDWENVRFTNTDLKQVDPATNKFVFMNDSGERLVLTKVKEKTFHYDAF